LRTSCGPYTGSAESSVDTTRHDARLRDYGQPNQDAGRDGGNRCDQPLKDASVHVSPPVVSMPWLREGSLAAGRPAGPVVWQHSRHNGPTTSAISGRLPSQPSRRTQLRPSRRNLLISRSRSAMHTTSHDSPLLTIDVRSSTPPGGRMGRLTVGTKRPPSRNPTEGPSGGGVRRRLSSRPA
jgi:hypothetical protein